jgi:glycosyltransferase involved in cell wall biosynthesis
MKIFFNNVDFNSRSGPNGFGTKLATTMFGMGHEITNQNPDVALSFITGHVPNIKNVLRLDGIYFNSLQDWRQMNVPIQQSYSQADEVVVQSEFDKELVTKYFGDTQNIHVIHNGTSLEAISKIESWSTPINRENLWMCASAWRPHKRLEDNIRYFQRFAQPNDYLFVAGSGNVSAIASFNDNRIVYVGDLGWSHLISLMKACSNFVHMALLDHCPNVVVDAAASGCKIHCASSGGTHEIVSAGSRIVKDIEWDFLPFELYNPPLLNFDNIETTSLSKNLDINHVAEKYIDVLS